MQCPNCGSSRLTPNDKLKHRWRCKDCKKRFSPDPKPTGRPTIYDEPMTDAERKRRSRQLKKPMTAHTAFFLDGKYAGQRIVMPDMAPPVFAIEQRGLFDYCNYHKVFHHETSSGLFVFYSVEKDKNKQNKLIAEALIQFQNTVTIEMVGKENYDDDRLCRMAVDTKMPINEFISRLLKERKEMPEYKHYNRTL